MNRLITANAARAVLVAVSFFLAIPAFSQGVPGTMSVEGVLTGSGGGPVADGQYVATFTIYDKAKDGKTLWQEGPLQVAVKGGRFALSIGATKPLDPKALAGVAKPWLGLKVGQDPELSRVPLHSVAFALRAGTANALDCVGCIDGKKVAAGSLGPQQINFAYASAADGIKGGDAKQARALKCTGCVSVAHMKFDKDVDLGGNALSAGKITSGTDVVAKGTIAAKEFVGDGSKLTGIKTPAGECKTTGEVVKGINPDGSLKCVKALDPSALPKDGIDEISNGLIANQFIDAATSGSAKIPDNNPAGVMGVIDFPDIGVAQDVKVTVDVSNSDTADIAIFLFPPNAPTLPTNRATIIQNYPNKPTIDAKKYPHYVLHMKTQFDKSNKTIVKTTFPKPTKEIAGSIHGDWLNKNIKGKWRLLVVDTAFLNNQTDGQINSWRIDIQTLSNKKVQIKGDLYVNNNLYVAKNAVVEGDVTIKGKLTATGGLDSIATPGLHAGRRIYTTVYAARQPSDCPKGWSVLQSNQYSGNDNYIYGNITGSGLTLGSMNSKSYGQAYLYFGSHHNNVQYYCYKEHIAPTGRPHTSFFMYQNGKGAAGCPQGYNYLGNQTIHGHTSTGNTAYLITNENGWYMGYVNTYSWSYHNNNGKGAHRRSWTTHIQHICYKIYGVEDDPATSTGVYPVHVGLHTDIKQCPAGWESAPTTDYDGSNGWVYNYLDDTVSVTGGTGSWWQTNGGNYLARQFANSHVKNLCWKYFPVHGRGGATVIPNDRTDKCPSSDYVSFSASNVKGWNGNGYIHQSGYGTVIGGLSSWWHRDDANGYTAFSFTSYVDKRVCLKVHNVKK